MENTEIYAAFTSSPVSCMPRVISHSTGTTALPVKAPSWLNSGYSGTLLPGLHSLGPTKKSARAQWSEFNAIKSDDDDDDDDDDNFLYNQSSIYHLSPADECDEFLSASSYHDNYKHDNLSSDLLCQDEETDSTSEGYCASIWMGIAITYIIHPQKSCLHSYMPPLHILNGK
jgi:hypothetical protein